MSTVHPDWTGGPAKWAAVVVLGVASIVGMCWSVWGRRPVEWPERPVQTHAPTTTPPANSEPPATKRAESALQSNARPREREAPAPAPPKPAKININTASAEEIELLPGIGPQLAQRIVEHRTKNGAFKTVDGLDAVSGIGEKTIAEVRAFVTTE